MSDNRPEDPDGKRGLIAPLVIGGAVLAVVAIVLIFRPSPAPPGPAPEPAPIAAPPAVDKPTPLPAPALTRVDLIRGADAAASVYAAGEAAGRTGSEPLVGQRFSIRVPFGCKGPTLTPGAGQTSLQFDAQGRTLKLTARAADWLTLPLVRRLPNIDEIEGVEGFWLPHPWADSEACPAPRDNEPAPVTATPATAQTLGLARIFEVGGSRALRRAGRPYEFVRRIPENDANLLGHSYRMALEGRIVGFADGRAIRCWSESPDHRPLCLYAVEFDRVAFEDAVDGAILAEWRE